MRERNPILPSKLSPLGDVLPDRLIAFAFGSPPHALVAAVDVDDLLGTIPAEDGFLLGLTHRSTSHAMVLGLLVLVSRSP
jgi:hypothetical protein